MTSGKDRLGSDPFDLSFIKDTSKEAGAAEPSVKLKAGRPATSKRVITKTSQEGLDEGYTRATFIVREKLLEKLKDYAYTDRRSLKVIINEILEAYLKDKRPMKRPEGS